MEINMDIYPPNNKNINLKEYILTYIPCHILYNSQYMEINKMPNRSRSCAI